MGSEIVRIYSKLQFSDPKKYQLYQVIDVHRNQSSKSIEIRVDLISSPIYLDGLTFVMNLETAIENNDSLFTDVNGLYLTRREMNEYACFYIRERMSNNNWLLIGAMAFCVSVRVHIVGHPSL